MSTAEPLASWPRSHFQAGGGDAHLFYKIHGAFGEISHVLQARHRSAGVPAGCDLMLYKRPEDAETLRFGLKEDDYFAEELRRTDPGLFAAAATSPQCLILRGKVPDPDSLDYFRDAIGLVMALLESG